MPQIIFPIAINLIVVSFTLAIAAGMDIKNRSVPITLWKIPEIICGVMLLWFYLTTRGDLLLYLLPSIVIPLVFYLLAFFGIIGGADAIAVSLISLSLPVSPWGVFLFPVKILIISSLIGMGVAIFFIIKKEKKIPFMVPLAIGVCLAVII